MKKVLIISPHFPPINAPDMQRVRMSLPYYRDYGWEAIVITVDSKYIVGFKDEILIETIPKEIIVHKIKSLPFRITRLFGLGSLSLRSLPFYFQKVNKLLKNENFDLIFFSTTMFHVGVLGPYWKWRFKVPFVIDLQDPWRNDFYLSKPRSERPPKFWFAYLLLKWTEQIAIPSCDGIISVSEGYLDEIKNRYQEVKNLPMVVIPFGASFLDFQIVKSKKFEFSFLKSQNNKIKVAYIGAITPAFIPIIRIFFNSFIISKNDITKYHFYFIGTSYSSVKSSRLVEDLSQELGISEYVTERSERIPYFEALKFMQAVDILFIPGSTDKDYNASKVYNAIVSRTPIFSIFNNKSEVKKVIEKSKSGYVLGFDTLEDLQQNCVKAMEVFFSIHEKKKSYQIPLEILASHRTKQQSEFFRKVLNH